MSYVACRIPLPSADGRLTLRAWLGLLLGAAILLLSTYVVEPNVFSSIDWLRIHVYYKEYLAAAIRHGRLPLWNPHVMLGRPFLADHDSVAFYPPSAAYLLLDVRSACVLGIGIHLALGLYGTLKFARALGIGSRTSWAAAFVFMASAPIVGSFSSGLINYGAALCYLPLVFYLLLRLQAEPSLRRVSVLALVLGFQILAGHPQATWLTGFGAGLLLLGRRLARPTASVLKAMACDLAALAIAAAAAAAMAAVVLLPLAELAAQSNRQTQTLAFAGSFAMPLLGWLSLAIPNDPRLPIMANAQCYAGIAAFLLAPVILLRWREANARALVLCFAGAALLAAGNATPVFALLYRAIPGLADFRIPARASVLMTLALVMAAGISFSAQPLRRREGLLALAALAGLAMAAVTGNLLVTSRGAVLRPLAHALVVWHACFIVSAAVLLGAWWRRDRFRSPRAGVAIASLLAALTLVDLGIAGWKLRHENREKPTDAAESVLARGLRQRGLLASEAPPPRVATSFSVHENSGMRHGWSLLRGYTSTDLARVWEYIHVGIGLPLPTVQLVYPEGEIMQRGPFAYDSMALVAGVDPASGGWVLNNHPDPRAYLAPSAVRVSDHHQAAARMRDGHPFHQIALIEWEVPASLGAAADESFSGRVAITRFEPERIALQVESPRPALLVLAEPWFPGWNVEVNGRSSPCFPANAWMRATLVPAGASQVVFAYRSTYLRPGLAVSVLMFVLLGVLALRRGRVAGREARDMEGASLRYPVPS